MRGMDDRGRHPNIGRGRLALLPGHRGGIPSDRRCDIDCSRLQRGPHAEPDLSRRVQRRDRPRRIGQIEFDPTKVSYEKLLDAFWENHDPTTLNRQAPDVGSHYRSAIFFHSPAQEEAARRPKARLEASKRFRRPIVTEIEPATDFHRAEDYHQQYLEKRGLASCHVNLG